MKVVLKSKEELFTKFYEMFNKFQEEYTDVYMVDATRGELNEIFQKHVEKTPIFRKRPTWDCSYCRHSIREVMKTFTITDDYKKLPFAKYILDRYDLDSSFKFLNDMLKDFSKLVYEKPVKGRFKTNTTNIGVKENIESESGILFKHFYFKAKEKYTHNFNDSDSYNGLVATIQKYSKHTNVLKDILYYIEENYIYRGSEKLGLIEQTLDLLQTYNEKIDLELFIWKHIDNFAKLFNRDVISTLADDLIEGKDPEEAISAYNTKVAPENYRQPKTEILSAAQIKTTEQELQKLGYNDFVNKFSFARPQDIRILDVLWTNRKVDSTGALTDLLSDNIKTSSVNPDKVTNITFKDFMELLKNTKDIEIDVSKLEKVVLIKDNFEQPVFKWQNHINYCYQTGLADVDEVSRRVKDKGGNIDAKLRFSLYWENLDDLDLHLEDDTDHIYYGNKRSPDTSFQLDIDMNVSNPVRGAVENIYTTGFNEEDINREFEVYVHNFTKRETPQKCLLNVYLDNKLVKQYQFRNPASDKKITLLKFTIDKNNCFKIIYSNKDAEVKLEPERKFVKVDTVLLSPNYWEKGTGNKHIFFLKKGTDISLNNIRPYNIEQIRDELVKHRKVLQILSRKIQIKGKPELVGWGISFSKPRQLLVKVNGRPYLVYINPNEDITKGDIQKLVANA